MLAKMQHENGDLPVSLIHVNNTADLDFYIEDRIDDFDGIITTLVII